MIGYVTLGTNDLPRACAFYDALLGQLGAKRIMEGDRFVARHINEDPETPTRVKARMQELLHRQAFATAMQYCFDVVWDRGFEDDPLRDQRRFS